MFSKIHNDKREWNSKLWYSKVYSTVNLRLSISFTIQYVLVWKLYITKCIATGIYVKLYAFVYQFKNLIELSFLYKAEYQK